MRAIHLVVGGAVLAVGLVVYLLLDLGGAAGRSRQSDGAPKAPPSVVTPDERSAAVPRGEGFAVTLEVVGADGSPAGGAEVAVAGPDRRVVRADDAGTATIDGLAAGRYNLIARQGAAVGALDFELAESRDLGRLRLSDAIPVRGHVLDAYDRPLPNASVVAFRTPSVVDFVSTTNTAATPDEIVARATAGGDGAYTLLLPGAGTYALRAGAAGHGSQVEEPRPFQSPTTGMDFHLLPAEEVTGIVVDEGGTAVANARVLLVGAAPRQASVKEETWTGTDGRFSVPAPGMRWLTLSVAAPGFARHQQGRLRLPAKELRIVLERGITVRARAVHAGKGVPDLQVTLRYLSALLEARTDAAGAVVFEHVPSETSGRSSQRVLYVSGGAFAPAQADLSAREPDAGVVDAGDIELVEGGTIRGRVLEQTTGRPVAGARVVPFGGTQFQLLWVIGLSATSAADGSYLLEGVPLTVTTVIASHAEYVALKDPRSIWMETRRAPPLFEEGRRLAEHDVELLPAATVSGVVLGPDGKAAANAKVALAGNRGRFAMFEHAPDLTVSDAQGRFELGGLRALTKVSLVASHRAFGSSEPVEAQAGKADAITLRLRTPLGVTGIVVDEKSQPVRGVRVSVDRPAEPGVPSRNREVEGTDPGLSDDEGRFFLRNVPPGEMTLRFDHRAYLPSNRSVAIEAGTESTDLGKIVLARGPGITGTVVDAQGAPMAGVTVQATWLAKPGQRPPPATQARRWTSATSDAGGRFEMFGLVEGNYQLRTWKEGFFDGRPKVRTGAVDVQLVLRAAATLKGRVLGDGRPLERAVVSARTMTTEGRGDSLGGTRTDPDGRFELGNLPPDDAFRLVVSHPGYKDRTFENVSAGSGGEYPLVSGIRIGGLVVDEAGEPVERATVRVYVERKAPKWARTDQNGLFQVGGLDEGKIEVQLTSTNLGFLTGDRVPVEPGEIDLRIVAQRGETIEGSVVDRDGAPVRGLQVRAADAKGNVVGQAWIWNDAGTFRIRGLPEGSYSLTVLRVSGGSSEELATVAGIAGGATGLQIRLAE